MFDLLSIVIVEILKILIEIIFYVLEIDLYDDIIFDLVLFDKILSDLLVLF